MFPRIGVPQNGWCIMENPIRTDGGTIIFGNTHLPLVAIKSCHFEALNVKLIDLTTAREEAWPFCAVVKQTCPPTVTPLTKKPLPFPKGERATHSF